MSEHKATSDTYIHMHHEKPTVRINTLEMSARETIWSAKVTWEDTSITLFADNPRHLLDLAQALIDGVENEQNKLIAEESAI